MKLSNSGDTFEKKDSITLGIGNCHWGLWGQRGVDVFKDTQAQLYHPFPFFPQGIFSFTHSLADMKAVT